FIKISGFTEEELLGQPHNIVRHPDMPPAAFEHMWSTLGTVAKLAMRQPFVLFKGLTFQKLCLPGAFRPGDHHN
ncbi:PAS domain-containing protein, partial [Escherichia coli]|nr:PAS domain-containing protein [Escherichia coli]